MSVFSYRALDERAVITERTISADSARAARDLLRGKGYTVKQVTEQRERYAEWQGRNQDPRWTEIRIDYVQHALSALLQYSELFLVDGS